MSQGEPHRNERLPVCSFPDPRLEYIGNDADRIIFGSIQFKMPPVGIAGIIGPHGGGKTPPFKMITGGEQRDVSTIGMRTVPLR